MFKILAIITFILYVLFLLILEENRIRLGVFPSTFSFIFVFMLMRSLWTKKTQNQSLKQIYSICKTKINSAISKENSPNKQKQISIDNSLDHAKTLTLGTMQEQHLKKAEKIFLQNVAKDKNAALAAFKQEIGEKEFDNYFKTHKIIIRKK